MEAVLKPRACEAIAIVSATRNMGAKISRIFAPAHICKICQGSYLGVLMSVVGNEPP